MRGNGWKHFADICLWVLGIFQTFVTTQSRVDINNQNLLSKGQLSSALLYIQKWLLEMQALIKEKYAHKQMSYKIFLKGTMQKFPGCYWCEPLPKVWVTYTSVLCTLVVSCHTFGWGHTNKLLGILHCSFYRNSLFGKTTRAIDLLSSIAEFLEATVYFGGGGEWIHRCTGET